MPLPSDVRARPSDIYAAGVIFYQLLTNRKPTFDTYGKFVWIDGARITPAPLRSTIEKMIKTQPSDRIQNFAEVHDLLAQSENATPTKHEPAVAERNNELRKLILRGTLFLLLLLAVLILYLTGAFRP